MVMEAKALEARPIGQNEVRITNVWTVEGTNEFSTSHDPTPNLKEIGVPALGGPGSPPAFNLRIHAEAGEAVVAGGATYMLEIKAICLTNPGISNTANLIPFVAPGLFSSWEHQQAQEMFTRDWNVALPSGAALSTSVGTPVGHETDEVWQYYVILRHTPGGGASTQFACYGVSEPIYLVQ